MRRGNQTILTLVGVQGVGKGVLGQILRELVGERNYYEARDEILKNKFNAPLCVFLTFGTKLGN